MNDETTGPEPLWQPEQQRIDQANLTAFTKFVELQTGETFADYDSLYQWSIEEMGVFWSLLWDFCEVIGDKGDWILLDGLDLEKATWFPHAKLNFAENLLRERSDEIAISFRAEDQRESELTFNELYQQVAAVSAWMKQQGVRKGDRVAAYLPNMPETIVAMLAATSLGAIWTSTSPDFGEDSVIDRFGQTEPVLLFCVDGYFYNGKAIDVRDKVAAIIKALPGLKHCVEIPLADLSGDKNGVDWKAVVDTANDGQIEFVKTSFNHPLYIL